MSEENASAESGQSDTSGESAAFTDGFADEELQGWAQNRNFESPEKMANSYRELERTFGHDKAGRTVVMPGDDASDDDMNSYYNKLGRPDLATEYSINVPEGEDPAFSEFAKGMFHEAGLSQSQVSKITGQWDQYVSGQKDDHHDAYNAGIEESNKALRSEWGDNYDKNIGVAQNASKIFGFDGPTIDKLEESLGFGGLMKMMHNVGSKVGEDSFVSGGSDNGFGGQTPNQAISAISDLKADAAFRGRLMNGDKSAQEKWDRLHRVAYGQG